MVKFAAGTANLDVSGKVRTELLNTLKTQPTERRIIYIVPEQFEYATERAMYSLLEENGLLTRSGQLEIRTFSSLVNEVLAASGQALPIADDIVKSIAMYKAISDTKAELSVLGSIRKKRGFAQKILETVNSFKAVGIGSRELEKCLDEITHNENPISDKTLLLKKLTDVSLLFTNYSAVLEGKFLDAPDTAAIAAQYLSQSGVLDGADIFVDCFNDFTNGQLSFIKRMITVANSVLFGFSTDADSDNEVFAAANSNIYEIIAAAENEDIATAIIKDGIPERIPSGSPLSELTRCIFRKRKSEVPSGNSIELVSASDVYEELDFVCSKIISLVEENGLRYNNFAVLCSDQGSYSRFVENTFKKYNIPFFMDNREPIIQQPLVNTIFATLNALENFSVETVLSCLKTGFYSKYDSEKEKRVGLSDYDINAFESYVYEWALETEHLKKPFRFTNKHADTDYEMLAAEEIRRTTAMPIWEFSKEIPKSGMDGAELTEKLYYFIKDTIGIKRALTADTMGVENSAEKIELYTRLWNMLVEIFEALHKQLKGVKITLADYTELFRELCTTATLSSPPQMADTVLVGDIDRTRADNIKAVFIVGADYETFPTPAAQSGIFSQYETELIRSGINGINGGSSTDFSLKSVREQFSLSLYRAYKALSLPTDYLCISCPERNSAGDYLEKSEITEEISRIFGISVKAAAEYSNEFYCRSIRAAKSRYAQNIAHASRENAVLERTLTDSGYNDFVEKLREIHTEHTSDNEEEYEKLVSHNIDNEYAQLLFPTRIGATSVEKLCACRFNYFAEFGLGIQQKNQRSFNPSKRGDAIHFILEKIVSRYSGDLTKLCKLRRADLQKLARDYLAQYCAEETNNTFNEDARTRFLFDNIANSATDVLITMQMEFYARGYRPKFFELNLSDTDKKYIPDNDGAVSAEPANAELYTEETSTTDETPQNPAESSAYITTAPLTIKLDNRLSVVISGRIDRVDMFTVETDGKSRTYVRAVDYKSSVHNFNLCNAMNGMNIQMLLYLIALLNANKNNPTVNLTAGGLSYIPSKSSGAQSDITAALKLLAISHKESSLLVEDEITQKDVADYSDFLINRIIEADGKAELMSAADVSALSPENQKEYAEYSAHIEKLRQSFTPDKFNSVDIEHFDELQADLTDFISGKLNTLFSGDVSAVPLSYKEKSVDASGKSTSSKKLPCDFCRFNSICKNAGKYVCSVDEKEWENKYSDKGE